MRPGPYDEVAVAYGAVVRVGDRYVAASVLACCNQLAARWIRPGAVILDAGAGTGERTRALLAQGRPARSVARGASNTMLARARTKISDPRVEFLLGDVTRLPFPNNTFDLVFSACVVEVLPDPRAAVQEFTRVIKPDGLVLSAFCSRPEGPVGVVRDHVVRRVASPEDPPLQVSSERERPYHHSERSSLRQFSGGLTTVATVGKCCPITAAGLQGRCAAVPGEAAGPSRFARPRYELWTGSRQRGGRCAPE